MPKTKPKKKPSVAKRVSDSLAVPILSAEKLRHNEAVYQAALLDPWSAPDDVRIPDANGAETATIFGKGISWNGPVQGTVNTSEYFGGIVVFPQCGDSGSTPKTCVVDASSTGIATATWSTLNSYGFEEAVLAADAAKLRTVAMGVVFRVDGKQQNLHGRYGVGFIRMVDYNDAYVNNIDNILNSKDVREYSVDEMVKGVSVSWRPGSYELYQTSTSMNVPAACWQDQTLATASWDEGEILPICVAKYQDSTGPGLLAEFITRYEFEPVALDYQTTPTAAALGSEEAKAEMPPQPPALGTSRKLSNMAKNVLKTALQSDRVTSAIASGVKGFLPGWAQKGIAMTPKPVRQLVEKIPVVGGLLGKLWSLRARRLLVALDMHPTPENVKLMERTLMTYSRQRNLNELLTMISDLHTEHKVRGFRGEPIVSV